MTASQTVSFEWTPWGVSLGVIMVVMTAAACLMAWRRSGYRTGTGLLELLRLVIVTSVAVTLLQPEWVAEYRPDRRASIVVLVDESRSMLTPDVIDESNPGGEALTRAASAEPLQSDEFWAPLADRFEIVQESFSSTLPEPAEGTDLGMVLTETLRQHQEVVGVVLASDGDWNTGEPPAVAAGKYRMRGVPVFVVARGSESRLPDLDLSRVDAPTFGVLGKPLRIPFVVDSSLPRETTASVTLTPSEGTAVTRQIKIPAMGRLNETILWTPHKTGDFELTVAVPVDDLEQIAVNNKRVVPISIREEGLRVLLVESLPRWEYRYLRNALDRDPGVDVSCLLFHPGLSKVGGGRGYVESFPGTLDELTDYDVIFLGDVGVGSDQLTLEDCRLIKALVGSHASGLVWMPGMRGAHLSFVGTELEELYPVVLDASQPRGWGSQTPGNMELTETGRRSLLTQLEDTDDANALLWETLPGFQWSAAVERAKAGTEVLARHKTQRTESGRLPLLVTRTFGTGKVLFLGTDSAWRWREGVEDKYHYRFWGQVVRWMAYQRSMAQGETMRLFFTPDRPKAGDSVTLFASVMSDSGVPLQGGTVSVQIVGPTGKTETLRLTSEDEWGLYQGRFSPYDHGQYQLRLVARETQATLDTTLSVQNIRRERIGQPARFDVLQEIATITGGQMLPTGDLRNLTDTLAALPEPEASVRRLRLWCHPAWAGILVLLLGLFWTGRKLTGVI
jgi:hypothetical protein